VNLTEPMHVYVAQLSWLIVYSHDP